MEVEHRVNAALPFFGNGKVAHNRDVGIHVKEIAVNHIAHDRLEVSGTEHGRELFVQGQHLQFVNRVLQNRTGTHQSFCRLVVGQERHKGTRIVHTQRSDGHQRLFAEKILRGTGQDKKVFGHICQNIHIKNRRVNQDCGICGLTTESGRQMSILLFLGELLSR